MVRQTCSLELILVSSALILNKVLQIPEQAFVSNFSNVHALESFDQRLLRGDLVFFIMQEINNVQSEAYPIDIVGFVIS